MGGGPSGSSCAYWLAEAGWDVAVVEKKVFPREKTCGDGLTPRSVRQIADMGIEGALTGAHRFNGLRAHAFGKVLDLPWPEHPTFPSYGYVITRHDLDAIVNERAVKAGATVWQGTEAVEPILDDRRPPGPEPGAGARLPSCVGRGGQGEGHRRTRTVRARYVVVADGANSRFGRALGTARDRDQPHGDGPAGLLLLARPRPAPSSSPISTSATARATWCPATGGSSRWATAGSTSGSGCCPPTAGGRA